jgi:Tol biopolymer transport system component
MLDLASFDSLALLALETIAWSNVAVAAAFLLLLLAAMACAASDCLADRRPARRRHISRETAAYHLESAHGDARTPENEIPSEQPRELCEAQVVGTGWEGVMKTITLTVAAVSLITLSAAPLLGQSGHDLFQQALVKERADGDLHGAISLYERIIGEFWDDRTLAATALLQMGECYEKLGSTEAEKAYRRVLRDFADQDELVRRARTRLAALQRLAGGEAPPDADERSGIVVRQLDWENGCGSPSPDGRYLSYCHWETGDVGLYDIVTGESRRLTTDGTWMPPMQFTINAQTSPDGKQVAHSWTHGDSGIGIRVVGVDAGPPRTVFRHGSPDVEMFPFAWSWDGGHIAGGRYDRPSETCEIVWISTDDGSVRPLRRFDEAFWMTLSHSPDDRYLAFDYPVEDDGGRYDVAMVATDATGEVPLVRHPANDKLLGWLPGTENVLFISDRSGTWDAWAIRVENGAPQGRPWPFKRNIGQVRPMGYTSDGSLFYSITTRRFTTSIAPFDPETGRIRLPDREPFIGSFRMPDWSPNGEYLAYMSEEQSPAGAGHYDRRPLHVRHVVTGEDRVLAGHLGIRMPRWSPDGRSILVVGYDRADEREGYTGGIYRVDAESGEATAVVELADDVVNWWFGVSGIWSADGGSVIYAQAQVNPWASSSRGGELRVRDLESGHERVLYRDPHIAARLLALSPDGQWVVFAVADSAEGSTGPYLEEGGRLLGAHLTDGRVRELVTFEASETATTVRAITWAPGGRHLLVLQSRDKGSEFLRVAVEGGELERLAVVGEPIVEFAIPPTGDRIAYATYVQQEQIWVMENLKEVLGRER